MFEKLANWYFRPRPIETRGGGRLYRLLGVRHYKHYLPTSGDLVSRLRASRRLEPAVEGVLNTLTKYERVTRSYELRHLAGAVLMVAISWWAISVHQKGDWAALLAANLLINGYPIMVQRYNRVRLVNALHKAKARQSRRSPGPR